MASKGRYFACVVYVDSLPVDFKERINFSGLKIAISPWHNMDQNADGLPKKPHRHVIIVFNGPVTREHADKVCKEIFNGTVCIRLDTVRGYYRYFCHLDNPEKYQYQPCDIEHYNGFCIDDFCQPSQSELREIRIKIEELICEYKIKEYGILNNVLRLNGEWEMYDYVGSHTIHFSKYLTSLRESGFFD